MANVLVMRLSSAFCSLLEARAAALLQVF